VAFPTIPTAAAGRVLTNTQADTSGTRTFPDLSSLTKSSGDLLVAIIVAYNSNVTDAAFSSWGGGFTELADFSSSTTMAVGAAYKVSTGSETGTFSVTQASTITGHAAMILLAIPGAHWSTAPECSASLATGTTGAANPASLNPSGWDVEDTLWIAVAGSGETSTTGSYTGVASAPTNYSNYVDTGISADAVGGVEGAVAFRQNATAAEDVGTFGVDTSNARNAALVIAVRPSVTSTKTGYGKAGTAGYGTSSKTSAGGGTTSEKTGFGRAGCGPVSVAPQLPLLLNMRTVAAQVGARVTEHPRSGRGVAGLTATGTDAHTAARAGYATVAGVGAGASSVQRTHTKAGYATVGLTARGADSHTAVESGAAIAGTVAAGSKARDRSRTGTGTVGTAGTGTRAAVHARAGYATAGTVGTGSRELEHQRTGTGAAGTVGTGGRELEHARAGAGTVGTVGAGFAEKAASGTTHTKAGYGVAGVDGYGSKARDSSDTGYGTAGTAGYGSKSRDSFDTGAGVVGLAGSGADSHTAVETGAGVAGTVAAGVRELEHHRTGAGVAGTVAAGADEHDASETGTGIVGATATGSRELEHHRAGTGIVGTVGAGASQTGSAGTTHTKAGYATVGTTGSGSRTKERAVTGTGTAGTVATGTQTRELHRAGTGTAVLVAVGTRLTVHTRNGTGVVTLVAAGTSSRALTKAGYATVGGDGYGVEDTNYFRTDWFDRGTPTGRLVTGSPQASGPDHGTPAGRLRPGRPQAAPFDHGTPSFETAYEFVRTGAALVGAGRPGGFDEGFEKDGYW